MKKTLVVAAIAAATLLGAGAANAARVSWSVGVALPGVQTVVAGPGYYAPRYYGTRYYAPSYYPAPPVVYEEPAPVYYAPSYPAYYGPSAVVYSRPYIGPRYHGWAGGPRHYGGVQVHYRR